MPRRCAVYGCRGNYTGEPYTKCVSFPTDEETRLKWISALPIAPSSLVERKIFGYVSHTLKENISYISWIFHSYISCLVLPTLKELIAAGKKVAGIKSYEEFG